MLVYDISSQPSFDSLSQWCRDIEQYAGGMKSQMMIHCTDNIILLFYHMILATGNLNHDVLRVLVGNKCDKEREIPLHIAEQFAHNNHFDLFMETSALQAENVEKLFYEIAEILVQKRQSNNGISNNVNTNSNNVNLDKAQKNIQSCFSCQ